MKEITEKNMLDWLEDARLSAAVRLAALGDGEEERVQDSPEAREVCIINAIEARVKEPTALEFLLGVDEKCVEHESVNGKHPCDGCPFDGNCIYGDCVEPSRAIDIFKSWKRGGAK